MDGNRVAAVLAAVLMVTSMVAAPVGPAAAASGDDEPDEPVPASYYGNVTVDGEPAPVGTEVAAVVDGDVQDTITVEEAGQYGGPGLDDGKLVVDAEDGDEVEFLVDGDPVERTEPETVTWEAEEVKQVDLRGNVVDPILELDLLEAPDNVTTGDDIELVVAVTNDGAAGEADVNVTVDGAVRAQESVDLDDGESVDEIFVLPTEEDDGDTVELLVESEDDAVGPITVDLEDPANFAVDLEVDDAEEDFEVGDELTGSVNVTNTGEQAATQDVTVTLDDREVEVFEDVTVAGGATNDSLDFEATIEETNVGEATVTAASEDDDEAVDITVLQPPTFTVDVIEAESDLEVVAGQDGTIVAEIENEGELGAEQEVTLTNVTAGADDGPIETEDIDLEPGAIEDFAGTFTTDAGDVGELTFEVDTGNETETVSVEVEDRDAFLEVTIDELEPDSVDEPAPEEDEEEVFVNATLENLGTNNTTQTVTVTAGDEEITEEFTVDGAETETLNETVSITEGDAPEVDVAVASEDDTDEATLDVVPLPAFNVTIEEATNVTPVPEDGGFAPNITATNVGGQEGDVTVEVVFDGNETGTFAADDGVASDEEVILVEPEAGFEINVSETALNVTPGDRLLEAIGTNNVTEAVDDTTTERVTVGAAPDFEVDLSPDSPATVDLGADLTAEVTVENTGDVDGDRPLFLEVGDREIAAEDIALGAGNETTETFDITTRETDIGTSELTASTPDDAKSVDVTVREPAEFLIEAVDIDEDPIAGEEIEVDVDVENVGGNAANTTDVRLFVDGADDPTEQSVTLAGGEDETVTVEVTPEAAGDLVVTAVTDDDIAEAAAVVGEPGALNVELRSVTDPVQDEETLTASIDVANVGDGLVEEETLRLRVDGSIEDSVDVTLDGGERDRVTLETTVDRNLSAGDSEPATVDVTVGGEVDAAETITVEEPEGPFVRVSNLDISEEEVLNQSQTLTVTADLTNVGDEVDTQDIDFAVGEVSETNESLELEPGNDTTVEFEFDPIDVAATGTVEFTVESAEQTATGTLVIEEPEPGTPAIVDVDFDAEATQEEAFAATVTVENVGDLDLDGDTTVALTAAETGLVEGAAEQPLDESGSIAPGATETVTLTVEPEPEPRAGAVDRTFEVTVGNETVPATVPVDFEGITSGVAEAEAGDTVVVEPGTYEERSTVVIDTEDVTINAPEGAEVKSPRTDDTALQIAAEGVEVTGLTLVGDDSGTAVGLAAGSDEVTLSSLRIEAWATGVAEAAGSSTSIGLEVVDVETGVALDGDEDSTVRFTRVARADETGILVASDGTDIVGSTVTDARVGVDVENETSIEETVVRNADDVGVRVTDVGGDLQAPPVNITNSALESNDLSLLVEDSAVDANQNWWGQPIEQPQPNEQFVERSSVAADDPLDSRPESDFSVSDPDLPASAVLRGEEVTIEPDIENDGTRSDLQLIELVDDGTVIDDAELELDADATGTVELTVTPDATDGDELNLAVRSLDNESDEETITIDDPAAFEIEDTETNEPVAEGEVLAVDVDVENVGDREGTVTARLLEFDDTEVDEETIDIDGTETEEVTLEWETDAVGTDDVTVELVEDGTTVDDETIEVTVEEAEVDAVDLDITTTLEPGQTTTATVTATYTNDTTVDVTDDATITSDDTDVATVDGATITAEDEGTAEIEAEFEGLGDTVELTVAEDDPPRRVTAPAPEPTDDLELEITESESATPALDPDTDQQVVAFDEVETVNEIAFETETPIDDVAVGDVDPATDAVVPPGATATVSEILVPEGAEDTPATIEFEVDADRVDAIDADPADLTALRAVDGEWEVLETTVKETDGNIVVTAETPGFSVFAVSAISEPDAVATVTPETVDVGEAVTLDASESTDRYGEIVAAEWTVDGEAFTDETVTVTLEDPGEAAIELTVTNDAGETDTDTETVQVGEPFTPDVTVTLDEETVAADAELTVEAVVENDGDLTGEETLQIELEEPDGTTTVSTETIELAPGADELVTETVSAPDVSEETTVTVTATYGVAEDTATAEVQPEDDAIPGFGGAVALVALLIAAALLARRGRE